MLANMVMGLELHYEASTINNLFRVAANYSALFDQQDWFVQGQQADLVTAVGRLDYHQFAPSAVWIDMLLTLKGIPR